MKQLILILLLLPLGLVAQTKLGLINDPDGYTNIRKEPNGKSEILDRINTGEIFEFKISESNWYKVWTNYGLSGYIHNSKIQEMNIECGCNGYGGTSSKPILRYSSNGKVLSVCGTIDSVNNHLIYGTEFLVQDCLNNKQLNEPSVNSALLQLTNGKILIHELAKLPISTDWQYELTPVTKNSFFFVGDRFITQLNNGMYQHPVFSNDELKLELLTLKNNVPKQSTFRIIDRALVLGLNDCKECEIFFLGLRDYLSDYLDGEDAERYSYALRIFELNKKRR